MEDKQEIDMSLINEEELMEEYKRAKERYQAINGRFAHLDYGIFLSDKREEAEKEGNIELAKCYSKLNEKYWEEIEEDERRREEEEKEEEEKRFSELEEESEHWERYRNAEIEKINTAFLSSGYESFGEFIDAEVDLARKNNDSDREWILEEAWKEYFEKSKKEFEAENEVSDSITNDESISIEGSDKVKNDSEDEIEYLESAYLDYHSEFLSSDYESFEDYISAKIEDAKDDRDDSKVQILYDVLKLHNAKSKAEDTKTITNDSLEGLTTEELIDLAARNQGTINENDQVIKDALIKRILEQQQEIGEQEEEIKRLRGQKVI